MSGPENQLGQAYSEISVLLCGQGSKWIRQWPINCYTSLNLIDKITRSVDYNLWLKRFGTQLNETTNQN